MSEIAPVGSPDKMLSVSVLHREAERLILASKSVATLKAYKSDWAHFETWAGTTGHRSMPATPDTVVIYMTALHEQQMRISTIRRRVATISQAHQHAGHDSPTKDRRVRAIVQGIARSNGTAPTKKRAVGIAEIRAMAAGCDKGLIRGVRDRAILLLGFMSAMRRSELASLDVSDVEFLPNEGLVLHLRRSKTDQEGRGRLIGIPVGHHPETCPVIAVTSWLQRAGVDAGPLFRPVDRHGKLRVSRLTDHAVACVIKSLAARAGLDPRLYSGHSLRSGFATSASRAGASEALIARQTGHRSLTMLRQYVQAGNVLTENAARSLGL